MCLIQVMCFQAKNEPAGKKPDAKKSTSSDAAGLASDAKPEQ